MIFVRKLLQVCFAPTFAYRERMEENPRDRNLFLLLLLGVAADNLRGFVLSDSSLSWRMLVIHGVITAVALLLAYYLLPRMLSLGSRLLKGTGDIRSFRVVLAWAYAPVVLAAMVYAPLFIYKSIVAEEVIAGQAVFYTREAVILFLTLVVPFWQFILQIKGFSVASKLSAGKSFIVLFTVGLIISIPLLLMARFYLLLLEN